MNKTNRYHIAFLFQVEEHYAKCSQEIQNTSLQVDNKQDCTNTLWSVSRCKDYQLLVCLSVIPGLYASIITTPVTYLLIIHKTQGQILPPIILVTSILNLWCVMLGCHLQH